MAPVVPSFVSLVAIPSAPDIADMTISERELELLRHMTPATKLEVMGHLIAQAYELKAAGLRSLRPELSEEEVQALTRQAVGGDVP